MKYCIVNYKSETFHAMIYRIFRRIRIFFNFWWSKVWGGAYTANIKRRPFFQNQNFGISEGSFGII